MDKQQKSFDRQRKLLQKNKYAQYGFDTTQTFNKICTDLNKSMPIKNAFFYKKHNGIQGKDQIVETLPKNLMFENSSS